MLVAYITLNMLGGDPIKVFTRLLFKFNTAARTEQVKHETIECISTAVCI